MVEKTRAQHEANRTAILRLLVEVGFHPLSPATILALLQDAYAEVTTEGLEFHLLYMADKGWVEVAQRRTPTNGHILWAKITAAGVDEYDRRVNETVIRRYA